MTVQLINVIVVGGSYVGAETAKQLAILLPATHRVLLVEPHSHFHHLFAFPRFSVVPNHEHKAFIPYTQFFSDSSIPNPSIHRVIQARVNQVHPSHVILDRPWPESGSNLLPFDYLAIATGTRLPAPGTMSHDEKLPSVAYFKTYQQGVKQANSIVIIGGGAVGVQMASDVKEVYPEKQVTLVQSRDRVMPKFDGKLHEIIKRRFEELGVNLITGTRAVVPENGWPTDGSSFTVNLQDGRQVDAQLVIPATGQIPNTGLLSSLPPSTSEPLLNPQNGFVRVKPTLQLTDPKYPNIFAIGDIADSGTQKAARPAVRSHVGVLTRNILDLIAGKEPKAGYTNEPFGIHLSLGLSRSIRFQNADMARGQTEPMFIVKEDGSKDMHVDRMWQRRGVYVKDPSEYHL